MTTTFRPGDPVAVLRGDRIWKITTIERIVDTGAYLSGDVMRQRYSSATGYELGIGGSFKHRPRITLLTPELLAIYQGQRRIALEAERRDRLAALVRTWLLTASAADADRLEALIGGADVA